MDTLKNLEGMITDAVERIRALKEEKKSLERGLKELQASLDQKNQEIERLNIERTEIKGQIEGLLKELDGIGS